MQTQKLPSLSDEEIWNKAGELGCYSASAQHFKSCFDFIIHKEGVLLYRMKKKNDRNYKIIPADDDNSLFRDILFHDPMEIFITQEMEMLDEVRGDNIIIMDTHNKKGKLLRYWENDCSVPYEQFKHYLDPATPMDCFWSDVKSYLDTKHNYVR